ncbi:MAG TPA: hypothetical protein VFH31_05130, partial [Pyrinomonadaceae bacterium]|nr:hypothetical protein [Pyrinomonadaceae bacterium]
IEPETQQHWGDHFAFRQHFDPTTRGSINPKITITLISPYRFLSIFPAGQGNLFNKVFRLKLTSSIFQVLPNSL